MKYKVGDRVKSISGVAEGKCGKVIYIDNYDDRGPYLVEFDDYNSGHSGEGYWHRLDFPERYKTQSNARTWKSEENLEPAGCPDMIIHCPTKEDYTVVLEKLENDYPDLRWSSGDKPTKFDYWYLGEEESCIKVEGNKIEYAGLQFYEKSYTHLKIIPASEFLGLKCDVGVAGEDLTEGEAVCLDIITKQLIKSEYLKSSTTLITNSNKPIMNKVVSAIKDIAVSSDDKLLRKHGMLDEGLNWTEDGRKAAYELEAQELGFNSYEELSTKYYGVGVTVFEAHTIVTKHRDKIIEQCKKLDKEEKKK